MGTFGFHGNEGHCGVGERVRYGDPPGVPPPLASGVTERAERLPDLEQAKIHVQITQSTLDRRREMAFNSNFVIE